MSTYDDPTLPDVVDPTDPIHIPAHARPASPAWSRRRMSPMNALAIIVVTLVAGILIGEATRATNVDAPVRLERDDAPPSTPTTSPPVDRRPPSTTAATSLVTAIPDRADPYAAGAAGAGPTSPAAEPGTTTSAPPAPPVEAPVTTTTTEAPSVEPDPTTTTTEPEPTTTTSTTLEPAAP